MVLPPKSFKNFGIFEINFKNKIKKITNCFWKKN